MREELTWSPKTGFLMALLTSLLVGSCGGGGTGVAGTGGSTSTTTTTSSSTGAPTGCTDLPRVAGASQPCCPDYGVDACGATLVCAALDGRTVATCYPEGIRTGGQTCTADALCVSRKCHSSGTCLPILSEACQKSIGCAPTPTDPTQIIACSPGVIFSSEHNAEIPDQTGPHTCKLVPEANGCGGPCIEHAHCTTTAYSYCTYGVCTNANGLCPDE